MISKIKEFVFKHKYISAGIILGLIFLAWWLVGANKGTAKATYVFAQAKKDMLISTLSGSGQVSASSQVDLKTQASGQLVYLDALNGKEMKAGQLIAKLDDSDAQKSIRDAQVSLESSQISYKKLTQPADALAMMQAENSLVQAQDAVKTAEANLAKSYEDGFADVTNAFVDYPTIVNGLNDVLLGSSFSIGGFNIDYYTDRIKSFDKSSKPDEYYSLAYSSFAAAKTSYTKTSSSYKATSIFSDKDKIESLISDSYETAKKISDAVKGASSLVQLYKDTMTSNNADAQSLATTHLSSLNSYSAKATTHLNALASAKTSIQNAKTSLENAKRSLQEKTQSLVDLKAGASDLDKQSSELSVKQREDALLDAKEKLNDYYVRAPFDGVIAKVSVTNGDTLSANAAVVTFVTKQKIATISLNEVDAAKVKVGQKANITFSAISDLNITGEVIEVDSLGTVSQGVVTYSAKIGFDTQDDRVKPGMSMSAKIIIDSKADALIVPSAAVKTSGSQKYVEMADEKIDESKATAATGIELKNKTKRQIVETGLSNDTYIEIISGLNEGDYVIAKSSSSASKTQTQSQTQNSQRSLFGGGGGPMIR